MIESFKSQKDMKRQRYQEVYMRSNWRKQMMISALALTLSATNVAQYLQVPLQMARQMRQTLHRQWEQRPSGIVGRKNGKL